MSGHSHWAGIKHKKALVDQKKGRVFSKCAKDIIMAARAGGGKLDANISLRVAVDAAKAVNMPKENIERAIKSGTGELPGVTYERLTYEGYGPGGIAILLDILTDNRNRTASELRKVFATRGGNLSGSVAWMFEAKGFFSIPDTAIGEDELMEIILNAGADDLQHITGTYEITCTPAAFHAVKQAIESRGLKPDVAELTRLPNALVQLDPDTTRKAMNLLNELHDHDDIQNVFTNLDVPAEEADPKDD